MSEKRISAAVFEWNMTIFDAQQIKLHYETNFIVSF